MKRRSKAALLEFGCGESRQVGGAGRIAGERDQPKRARWGPAAQVGHCGAFARQGARCASFPGALRWATATSFWAHVVRFGSLFSVYWASTSRLGDRTLAPTGCVRRPTPPEGPRPLQTPRGARGRGRQACFSAPRNSLFCGRGLNWSGSCNARFSAPAGPRGGFGAPLASRGPVGSKQAPGVASGGLERPFPFPYGCA